MNQLGLLFTATECNGWPKLKFLIDDDLIQDYEFNSSSALITLPIDLLDGEHYLDIELYGKSFANTVIVGDKIVQDQLVTLDTILIDDVIVPDFVKYKGVYTVQNQQTPQVLTWGVPGTWRLMFEHPIIDWVLDHKLKDYHKIDNYDEWTTSVYHPKKSQTLIDGFRELEDILANVKV